MSFGVARPGGWLDWVAKTLRAEERWMPGGVLSEQSLSKAAASQGLSEVETPSKAAAKAPRK